MKKKIIIVGGVAGGATTAARLRRLDEFSEIILLERGEFISFANCGLPYHIGGVIPNRESLIVQSVEDMTQKFNIDIRTLSEVVSIDKERKHILVKSVTDGKTYEESYDTLILSMGAQPIMPPIKGIQEASNLFTLRNIPDMDHILSFINTHHPKTATVIGGGFIGVEVMENLTHLGMEVTLVEMAPQVMGMFDHEMAQMIHETIEDAGVKLIFNDGVQAFENQGKTILLQSGKQLSADLIIFAIGIKPDSSIAKNAGLELTKRGFIQVDENLKTSDPNIYAIGDVIEVNNSVTHQPMSAALAGPANKQGRFVANHIYGIEDHYKGTFATSAAKIFDRVVASTGISERIVKQMGLPYQVIHLHPSNHASYYPGSSPIALKVVFNPKDGKIYGGQAIGKEGTEKRIDVLSTAMFAGLKVTDLKDLDLAYAPPFSSAKDPINMVGYIADNLLNDMVETISFEHIHQSQGYVLDIREEAECLLEQLPNVVNIPLTSLRNRLHEIPKDKDIYVYCQVGQRGYVAYRILKQNGFNVKNLDGGLKTYHYAYEYECNHEDVSQVVEKREKTDANSHVSKEPTLYVNACGLQCPGPIVQVYKKMETMKQGDVLKVEASDPGFYKDIQSWASKTHNTILDVSKKDQVITAIIQKGGAKKEEGFEIKEDKNGSTIVVFSQDLDKAIAAFIIASGARAMGKQVELFFTFWGLNVLRKPKKVRTKKTFMERMFGRMMPRGVDKLPISNMNMLGMGPKMIKKIMKKKNVDSLQVLMKNAMDLGVKFVACAMSMDIMGIKQEELIDGVEIGGVATYLGYTQEANHNLFI